MSATLVEGDCLDVLSKWTDAEADLVYLDPPFNTGTQRRGPEGAYPDSWPTVAAYLAFLAPRLDEIRRVLRPEGAILLHCDWRTVHHLRLELDRLFGADSLVNHLIWTYGLGGSSPRRFARKHDDILFYAVGPDYHFQPPMVPATSNRMKGRLKKATDVLCVPAINNMAAERVGYPTQKPVALLEILVGACCRPGGLVVDPFCGSGTTLVAAQRLDRDAIGIDVNPRAIELAGRRLQETAAATVS